MASGDVKTYSWAGGLEAKGEVRFGRDSGDGVHLGEFVVEEWYDSHQMGVMWAGEYLSPLMMCLMIADWE